MTALFCLISWLLLFGSVNSLAESQADGFDRIQALTHQTFEKQLNQRNMFVMFYAPWCGHCKNLKPTWVELHEKLKSTHPTITISKVDCTLETDLCVQQNVRGYPTLMYYSAGAEKGVRFKGSRSLDKFVEFIKEQSMQEGQTNQAITVALDDGVHILTASNFEMFTAKAECFVMFYAPWCGHCKKMKPAWQQLAKDFAKTHSILIGKVDCTEHTSVCKDMDVTGYPTLLYLKNGNLVQKYTGNRDYESLLAFVTEQSSKSADSTDLEHGKVEFELDDSDTEALDSSVVDLSAQTYQFYTESRGLTFVKFYAPWCGHCKRLAPIWEDLAIEYSDDEFITIARIDCTQANQICDSESIQGYPTLKLFHKGKLVAEYNNDRSLQAFKQFLTRHRPKDEL